MTFEEADARYPYDPGAREYRCTGLAKLACFEDPKMRRSVFDALTAAPLPRRERPDPRLAPASRAFLDTDDESDRRFP